MITPQDYAQRRKSLMKQLGPNSVAIVLAAPVVLRTESAEYPYRQSNNFAYLTGFPEPHAALVLIDNQSILYCQSKDPEKEIWTGKIIGQEAARVQFGFDEVHSIHQFAPDLAKIIEGKTVYACKQDKAGLGLESFEPLEPFLAEMRLIKSDAEIRLMQQAASISAMAHRKAMEMVKPGMKEYELAAFYEYEFKAQGGNGVAYESIVGSGKNACILHYRENSETLNDGDLVLVDAATEYHLYAADITRTFPVNGQFTAAQREIYTLVLHAQQRAIEAVKPGITWESVQEQVVKDLTQGLMGVGLLKGNLDELIETKAYRRFYMHGCGHWLGLDVHDVGSYKVDEKPRLLKPNMVVTVEPGLYISADDDIDPRWHHIGIRIEDDVQVTHTGAHVLSWEAPKTIEAVEACMAVKHVHPRH